MASLFNTPEYVFCFIGAQKAGVVFSPINFRLSAREVALHLDDSRPRAYVYDASLAAVAREAVRLADHRKRPGRGRGRHQPASEGGGFARRRRAGPGQGKCLGGLHRARRPEPQRGRAARIASRWARKDFLDALS